jgi:hypothetical protein
MIFLFYNKLLLRALVFLTGALTGVCAWHYLDLSAGKLGAGGVRDALAIVSFLFAGWLVMLIAEVADNHYVRVLGALSYGLGAFISYPWMFKIDGPKLAELEGGAQRLGFASLAFWIAVGCAVLTLGLLVTRLILDKVNYGRMPQAASAPAHDLPAVVAQPAAVVPDLAPIPVDRTPFGQIPAAPVAPPRVPQPVRSLKGTAGDYAGAEFQLPAGQSLVLGRQNAAIALEKDTQVSRQHATIEVAADGTATLRDLSSTNGSWANGERVTELTLQPGDRLRFGNSEFQVEA